MRPFVEKLHLDDATSFYVRTHRTPRFEVPWHQHPEVELILFLEGSGTAYIGNSISAFNEGDIFLLGANLPHTFQKNHADQIVSAVVVQFERDFLGSAFMLLPESRPLSALLQTSLNGIRIRGAAQEYLNLKIPLLESETGLGRIVCLVDCLNQVVRLGGYETVSTQEVVSFGNRGKERIDRICQFTIDHFSEPITLEQVAGLAAMSVPAFCSYFKKRTKKTYVAFLNEVRIGHACKLLMDTTMPVTEICYDSGFNTLANFNKQFLRIKKTTPSAFRKKMRAGVPLFNEV